jgi:hypothetical protein
MNNNQLKNVLKLAVNLSMRENKDIIPLLQKAFQIIEINELKQKNKLKKKKENAKEDPKNTKGNLKTIDDLIKKESDFLNKKIEKNSTSTPNSILLD